MGQQQDRGRWMMLRALEQQSTRAVGVALATALVMVSGPRIMVQALPPMSQTTLVQTPPEIEPFTLTGTLDETSKVLENGTYINAHSFEGVAGQIAVIDLISDEFDAYLMLFDSDNNTLIADDDNIGIGTNAHIVITLPLTGTYKVAASTRSIGETGRYELSIRSGDALDLASYLYRLGLEYYLRGDHWLGISLTEEAHYLWEQALGENHPLKIVIDLRYQALQQALAGNYAQEEVLLQQALAIAEEVEGDQHPGVAELLNDLATVTFNLGKYNQVEPLLQRALTIYEQAGFSEDVATILQNLALFYVTQGDHAQAIAHLERAIAGIERFRGVDHTHLGASLHLLAELYLDQENNSQAEFTYFRALDIFEKNNFFAGTAMTLSSLGNLYFQERNYTQAETFLLRALTLEEWRLGEHPSIAVHLRTLRDLYHAQEYIEQALDIQDRILAIEETNLELNLALGSEANRQTYIDTRSKTTDITLSLHLQNALANPNAAQLALTTVLRRKGRVLDAVTDTQQRLRQNVSPNLIPLLNDYTAAQTQLANHLYGNPNAQEPDLYRAQINTLRQRVEQLENELSRRSAEFRVETTPVEIEAVQALIPADAALVELVQYRPFDSPGAGTWGTPHYAAYILHSAGDPQWVDLGDAETINTAARAFLAATRTPDNLSHARTTARALDQLVMAPIRPLLGEATHLLLSPDSQLNLIPFAALVDEQNRYLVETYTLTHLTTGRDLLRLQNPTPSRQPPVILANPDYDTADPSGAQLVATSTSPRPGSRSLRLRSGNGRQQRSTDIANLRFGPLPGTEREVQAIAPRLHNPIVLTDTAATENALKQVQGPSILHIATHGFFLEDVAFVPPGNPRGEIELVSAAPGSLPTASNRPTSTENPLLRSGLALAGFNSRASGGEDGVLTALEAAGLDLRGTRLVVLSACETGVGAATNGEGVYGLRRAFVIAGAESQLMSLWKVDDEGTADLMAQYYERLLAGAGRSEALRQVQLAFLQTGGGRQHPYYWASFLFSGNWHPLPADEQ